MSASGSTRLHGCESCRTRHVKCDEGNPCAQCAKKGIDCIRAVKFRFRHSFNPSLSDGQFEFAHHQPWCRVTGKKLKFIDENIELYTNYEESPSESDGDSQQDHNKSASKSSLTFPLTSTQPSYSHPNTTDSNLGSSYLDIPSLLSGNGEVSLPGIELADDFRQGLSQHRQRPSFQYELRPNTWSLQDPGLLGGDTSTRHHEANGRPEDQRHILPTDKDEFPHDTCFGLCKSPLPDNSKFPVKDRSEAHLIRYYVDNLAPAFDLCDPDMTFSRALLEMAGSSHSLRHSILAISEKHRTSLSGGAKVQRTCLACSRTAFNSTTTMVNEVIFASIILLYFHEHVEVPMEKSEDQAPSFAMCDLLDLQGRYLLPTGLHQASFWAGLRMEIYLAIMDERPTGLNLKYCNVDRSMGSADDQVWARRIILHLVDVLEYCFSPDSSYDTYDNLVEYSTAWAASKPTSFEPVYVRKARGGETFPNIVLLNNTIMAAMQYYHLIRILLTAHNPKIPRLGIAHRVASRSIDHDIKSDVEVVCGIAETVNNCDPTHSVAVLAIALAGDRFTDHLEQEALLDILVKTEKRYAWSTWSIQQHLKEIWGWALH